MLPQPLPHDAPGFYTPGTPVREHHRLKREWSHQFWQRLGGQEAVDRLAALAAAQVNPRYGPVDPAEVDLFYYVPPEVSQQIWAVRLVWQHDNARLDFSCDAATPYWKQSPELHRSHHQILRGPGTIFERAERIRQSLREHAGVEPSDEFKSYASLSEVRRHYGRYDDAVRETGLK